METIALDVIDTHVHPRDPENFPDEERVYREFGAKSALYDLATGGVLMAHGMPNLKIPLTTYESFKKCALALKDYPAYGGLYFCYNGTNLRELIKCYSDPETRKHLMWVKIYPATKEGGNATTSFSTVQDMYDFSLEDGSPLDSLAGFCTQVNLSLTIHCEDPAEKARIVARKKYGKEDDSTEPNFVQSTVIPLCEKHKNLKFIVAHISHKDTVQLLEDAWESGLSNLYVEITPHHLMLSTTEIREKLWKDEAFGFCHPFVKISGSHRARIANMLLEGDYPTQVLYGSDHAPHTEAAKIKWTGWVPNHQGAQIMAAWFQARGLKLDDPRVSAFFHKNALRVFGQIPTYMDRFKKKAWSILFTPGEFEEGVSIPDRIHDGAVVDPWWRLLPDDLKGHWVNAVPRKAA
jgi:dihydroorotase